MAWILNCAGLSSVVLFTAVLWLRETITDEPKETLPVDVFGRVLTELNRPDMVPLFASR